MAKYYHFFTISHFMNQQQGTFFILILFFNLAPLYSKTLAPAMLKCFYSIERTIPAAPARILPDGKGLLDGKTY